MEKNASKLKPTQEVVVKYGILAAGSLALALVAVAGWVAPTDAAVLAEFSRPRPDDISIGGFTLDSSQDIRITSAGFGYRSGGTKLVLSNAWILDASTREVMWEMAEEREEWKEKEITEENYSVDLPAGTYEFYYSTYPHYRQRKWGGDSFFTLWGKGIDRVVDKLLDNEDEDDVDDLYRRFFVRVEGRGTALDEDAVRAGQDKIAADAIVCLRKLGDHEYIEQGFELKRAMKIHIYALGEGRKDGVYDYGWIMNADTGERVWRFTYDDSYHAGGGDKNRLVDSVFEAPAGNYVAVYGTDDSHSYDSWNTSPPFDPTFWGMTIRAENPSEASYASRYEYKGRELENVVVDLVKVGDDEYLREGFTVKKDMDLRVYALGEGKDGRMYDYGWIIDANTRDRVWEMDYDDTEHAGGGDKNRVVDEVVHFEKGDYIVHYATDGSHSYPHWNTTPPMDRNRWGITVLGTKGFKRSDVAEYTEEEDGNFLVRLTGVRDDEYLHETFTLDKETKVHIYALGEGVDGRMYDYGWIEDAATGRVVWEMTYRKTRHAGGASKNRMFSDNIVLEKGTYKVYYETDDSHSFRDWNADRPYEPENWGIAVRLVNSK